MRRLVTFSRCSYDPGRSRISRVFMPLTMASGLPERVPARRPLVNYRPAPQDMRTCTVTAWLQHLSDPYLRLQDRHICRASSGNKASLTRRKQGKVLLQAHLIGTWALRGRRCA